MRREFGEAGWLDAVLGPGDAQGATRPPTRCRSPAGGRRRPCAAPARGRGAAVAYTVAVNNQQFGPYTAVHLQQFLLAGHLSAATLVWRPGLDQWTPLSQVPELAALTQAPPSPPVAAPPLPVAPPLPPAAD